MLVYLSCELQPLT